MKVGKLGEFDFMIRLNLFIDKVLFYFCDKGEGYVKFYLDEYDWREFKDEEGFFNLNFLCCYFKKFVNEFLSDVEVFGGF